MSTPRPTTPDAPGRAAAPPLRFGFVRTAPWILGLLFCVLFAVGCHLLAQWQWARRIEVMHRVNRVLENYDDAPVPLSQQPDLFTDVDADREWTPVTLTGRYLVDETLVVRNRPRAGRPGYEVLVPFQTDQGQVIAVDRGWLPIGDAEAGRPDAVPAPDPATRTVVVRTRPGEPRLDREAPEGQVPSIDLAEVARRTGLPVAGSAYGLMVSEDPEADVRPQQLIEPAVDEGPHLSYAIQWYIFAVMGFGVWGYMVWQKARNDRADAIEDARDDGMHAAQRPPRPRPAPRRRGGRPTDEEAEDALFG